MQAEATRTIWISHREAMRQLAIGFPALRGLIRTGRVAVRNIEGSRPRVLASDIAKIADESTTRAVPVPTEAAPCRR